MDGCDVHIEGIVLDGRGSGVARDQRGNHVAHSLDADRPQACSALEQHVNELEQVSKAGVVITELANIARMMLDRTRESEEEMRRS